MSKGRWGAAALAAGWVWSFAPLEPGLDVGVPAAAARAAKAQAGAKAHGKAGGSRSGSASLRHAARGHAKAASHRGRVIATTRLRPTEPPEPPQAAIPLPPVAPRDRPDLTTASLGPAGGDPAKEGMRAALEARARDLAGVRPAQEALPILLPPRTITYDFENGTKTTVYGDDIVVTEPYRNGPAGVAALGTRLP